MNNKIKLNIYLYYINFYIKNYYGLSIIKPFLFRKIKIEISQK